MRYHLKINGLDQFFRDVTSQLEFSCNGSMWVTASSSRNLNPCCLSAWYYSGKTVDECIAELCTSSRFKLKQSRSPLYTITNRHGDILESGATAFEAAHAIMTEDGHAYEIRPKADGNGFALWFTEFSRNSTLGGRPMTISKFCSLQEHRSGAETEIYNEVIANAYMWCGCYSYTDLDYKSMREGIEE